MLSASSKNSCDTRLPFVVESALADFEREKRRGFKGKDWVGLERVRVVGHMEEEGVLGYYDVVPLLLLHLFSLDQNSWKKIIKISNLTETMQ